MAMVTLTNQTKHACTVDGWASISLVNAADEVVPVRTGEVKQPGAPVPTTLKPGVTAKSLQIGSLQPIRIGVVAW